MAGGVHHVVVLLVTSVLLNGILVLQERLIFTVSVFG